MAQAVTPHATLVLLCGTILEGIAKVKALDSRGNESAAGGPLCHQRRLTAEATKPERLRYGHIVNFDGPTGGSCRILLMPACASLKPMKRR